MLNHALTPALLGEVAALDAEGRTLLRHAGMRFEFSARTCHRIIAVARTVADLAGAAQVRAPHLAEAIGWRQSLGDGGWEASRSW